MVWGLHSSLSPYCMPHTRSARCPVLSPIYVAVRPSSAFPLVALWPSPLTWGPALAQPLSGLSGASVLYSWLKFMPFLGPGVVGAVGILLMEPCAVVVHCLALLQARRWRRPRPARHDFVAGTGSALPACSDVGGIPSPPCPHLPPPSLPHPRWPLRVHPPRATCWENTGGIQKGAPPSSAPQNQTSTSTWNPTSST